jgi:hypothetical protein
MRKSDHKVIVVATITILAISFLLTSNVFAEENGVIQIQTRGAGIGDNLKISAYTFQNSWEWNDTFTIGDNLVKQVNGVSSGDIINVCIINLKDEREGCSSGTFNSNRIVKINIDLGN